MFSNAQQKENAKKGILDLIYMVGLKPSDIVELEQKRLYSVLNSHGITISNERDYNIEVKLPMSMFRK